MVRRLYVEKRQGIFDVPAQHLMTDLIETFHLMDLKTVRLICRYDIEGLTDEEYFSVRDTVFSDPAVDTIYENELPNFENSHKIAIEPLPGQYDQRADSAAQCVQLVTQGERPIVQTATIVICEFNSKESAQNQTNVLEQIKHYLINPIESREASLAKLEALSVDYPEPADVEILKNFTQYSEEQLKDFWQKQSLAMSFEDILFCQKYFAKENHAPTLTEIKVLDTYWSDHCRHTTFQTVLDQVDFANGEYSPILLRAYKRYLDTRTTLQQTKPMTLMNLACVATSLLRKFGKIDDVDISEEVNACSIKVKISLTNGETEDWLVLFKNETHNHPTEIEPFGGAATCLGGAIRDPLSGRAYVYQAMRVTGAADPRKPIAETLHGKLPQKKIVQKAASGYSSYGNQIGIATGQVTEVYHEDFVAKRLEVGAVIGAVPYENVVRERPTNGDIVLLVGGRTGRDGCGGATGSSKEHDEHSLETCGSEVQKGNPPTERKLQRLFRHKKVSQMIKRCNDFGAGGVAVAIGELADGILINLDAVPKKYLGLDGTELAISESQERMAVVINAKNLDEFKKFAVLENVEATPVAVIQDEDEPRLIMTWRGKEIVNLKRAFLNTNGVAQHTTAFVAAPKKTENYLKKIPQNVEPFINAKEFDKAWEANLSQLNVCSQKGLGEMFDSTVGSNTVLMPFGGKKQLTPQEGMIAKIPVEHGDTTTATAMTFGFNPYCMQWSPFHGAVYAIVEATAKLIALGGRPETIRLSLQEYFERLGNHPEKWGKVVAALLGAFWAETELEIPAIGGKDSMSGTFNTISVPPSLIAFAVQVLPADAAVSSEFRSASSKVYVIPAPINEFDLPDFKKLRENYLRVYRLTSNHKILSASTVKIGGIAAAITKMCLGNEIGFKFAQPLPNKLSFENLFTPNYGTFIIEVAADENVDSVLQGTGYYELGCTTADAAIVLGSMTKNLQDLETVWRRPLEKIFPTQTKTKIKQAVPLSEASLFTKKEKISAASTHFAQPRVFLPVFPGTNCEYETAKAFEKAGAVVDTFVIRNLTSQDVKDTLQEMVKKINQAQIIMLSGGFSGGDEPDGSGKFIAALFRNPQVAEATMQFLKVRKGLMLGICNGFQALLKLGLVPYGEIRPATDTSPTLTFNSIGRHVSCMVQTRVMSNLSPWFNNVSVGAFHTIAVSHGEGRFVADAELIEQMKQNGQIATQYVDFAGNPSMDIAFNPNGSTFAIEGISSPDGYVLGKMGHSERVGQHISINVPGDKDQELFKAGVQFFK